MTDEQYQSVLSNMARQQAELDAMKQRFAEMEALLADQQR